MKEHAQVKGDGIQADKLRKIELDVRKLLRSDETNNGKEIS